MSSREFDFGYEPQKSHATETILVQTLDFIVRHIQDAQNWISRECTSATKARLIRRDLITLNKTQLYLVSSASALFETLHQLSFVKSAMCDESNLVILLKLMSSTSTSRRFLNWLRFSTVNLFPCKSRVFSFRRVLNWTNIQWSCTHFKWKAAKFSETYLKRLH